ncbi:MAG: NapC/NirT family cytochrome c [Thermoanaerobaculia bacterium]
MKIRPKLELSMWSLAGLLIAAGPLFAESLQTSYPKPRDIAAEWGMVLSLVVIVAAAGLIAYTLIARRKNLLDLHSKWILFLGIAVLPIPAIFMSTAVGLEHSKQLKFCNSCHAMDPFIDDMKDVASNQLAARHYKNRFIQKAHCYTCHTNYGIFGTMEAKLNGMKHMWGDFTGHWSHPIEISKPYQYQICLNCHAGAVRFEQLEEHDGVIEEVLSGEGGCNPCHELAHPARVERSGES